MPYHPATLGLRLFVCFVDWSDPWVDVLVVAVEYGRLLADIETAFQKVFDGFAVVLARNAEIASASAASAAGSGVAAAAPRPERLDGKQWVKELNAWKTALTPYFGPIFSDPLRALNKLMAAQPGATAALEEAEADAAARAQHKEDSIKLDKQKEKRKRELLKEKERSKKLSAIAAKKAK
jgi:hypothetical protein